MPLQLVRRLSNGLDPVRLALMACLLMALLVGYDVWRERQLTIKAARADTANLAGLLEEQVRQTLRRADAALLAAKSRIEALTPDERQSTARLRAELLGAWSSEGLLGGFMVIDGTGRQVVAVGAASGIENPGQDAGGIATRRRTGVGVESLYRPVRTRDGRWLWPVATSSAGGGPAGPNRLVAVLETTSMQRSFDALDTKHDGFVTLFLRTGWIVATSPPAPEMLSRNWGTTPLFTQHLQTARAATVQQVVVRDNTERIYSYRELEDYPVVVSVGLSLTDILAEWRARVWVNSGLLLLMSFGLVALATLLRRQDQRRQAAEHALVEAAHHHRTLLEHVGEGIVAVGADGRVESVNPAAAAMLGAPHDALVGRDLATMLPDLPTDPTGPVRVETLAHRADGQAFPAEVTLTGFRRDADRITIAVIRDVSELRRYQVTAAAAREQTERSERMLSRLTANLPVRIAYVDRELRYRFINDAHCQRYGLDREQILGRTREEITGQPISTDVAKQLARVLAGESLTFEFVERGSQGRRVIESRVAPDISADGTVNGFFSASADVTERHQQRQRLETALQERETLLREVYHRVKNNMQVVQSMLSLQRRALRQPEAQEALNDCEQRVRAMALVHEKLYQTTNLSAINLSDYTQDLLRQLAEAAGAHARGLTVSCRVDAFECVPDQAVPFGLLVTELVGNSLKHGFPHGRSGHIHVQLLKAPDGSELRVLDTGVGLPPDFDLTTARSMGLQLANSLASQLGGNLTNVHEGSGAVFIVRLPRLG
jgi:PAS domain S-box-containing protein